MSSNLTRQQYNEVLFNQDCTLIVIEHLDVYHVKHWTPEQFFARKSGNIIMEIIEGHGELTTFVVLLSRGIDLQMIHEIDITDGSRVVVSFRKAIGDRIGYAFVSIQKRRIPLTSHSIEANGERT